MFTHDIDRLVNVQPGPLSQQPPRCLCGETYQYAPVVFFINYDPDPTRYLLTGERFFEIKAYEGDTPLKVSDPRFIAFAEDFCSTASAALTRASLMLE